MADHLRHSCIMPFDLGLPRGGVTGRRRSSCAGGHAVGTGCASALRKVGTGMSRAGTRNAPVSSRSSSGRRSWRSHPVGACGVGPGTSVNRSSSDTGAEVNPGSDGFGGVSPLRAIARSSVPR